MPFSRLFVVMLMVNEQDVALKQEQSMSQSRHIVKFANRDWALTFYADPHFYSSRRTLTAEAMCIALAVLTAIVVSGTRAGYACRNYDACVGM